MKSIFRLITGECFNRRFIVSIAPCVLLFLVMTQSASADVKPSSKPQSALVREFCANTPFDAALAKLLDISTNGLKDAPEITDWKLKLHCDANGTPVRYELRCEYGVTVPNTPGLGRVDGFVQRDGACTVSEGLKTIPNAVVYNLAFSSRATLSFVRVSSNVLHLVNADGTLMVGNGGWSYTLNSVEHAEKAVEPELAATVPDMSYQISPLASGDNVFGVFEGRSPCQGIAKELGIPVPASGTKAKWRVTLYKDAATGAPSRYKVEGTLFRRGAREGTWKTLRGTDADPHATIFRLESKTEPAITLLRGDDNVLFFLDQTLSPRVGHCEFSYTLNRRVPAAAARP